eukprot:2297580-Alexandrium_andersonii.AAC.1
MGWVAALEGAGPQVTRAPRRAVEAASVTRPALVDGSGEGGTARAGSPPPTAAGRGCAALEERDLASRA